MKRTTWRLAVIAAALVAVPTATAAGYETPAKKNALTINVVSSPAQYVSGDDARIEIAVPDKTPLGDVDVTLNGSDVTSAFGPDPEGNHQLEGVVTGLPLGQSTIVASSHKKSKGNKYYDELEADEQPDSGPDLLRPAPAGVRLCDPGQRGRDGPAADPAVADVRDADGDVVRLPRPRPARSCPTTRPHRRPHRRSR